MSPDTEQHKSTSIKSIAISAAVISSMLSSLAWIFQGAAIQHLTPLMVASAQGLLTGAVYLVHLKLRNIPFPVVTVQEHRRELLQYTLLRNVIGSILICYALSYSESIKVMFLTKLEPYFIIFWVWLIEGKKISRSNTLLLLVHVIGAVLLSTGGTFHLAESQWGDVLLVIAIAVLSYSYLHASRLSKALGPIHLNGIGATLSGVCLLPLALVSSPLALWNPMAIGWAYVVLVVLLFNVFGVTLWYLALRSLDGWMVSALRAVGPVCAAPFAWLWFGEGLTCIQIGGAAIVLITSAILASSQRKNG